MVHGSRAGLGGVVFVRIHWGELLEEAGAEVFWEVGGDECVRNLGGPWGMPASKEERAV